MLILSIHKYKYYIINRKKQKPERKHIKNLNKTIEKCSCFITNYRY